jgi:hypothetical protein
VQFFQTNQDMKMFRPLILSLLLIVTAAYDIQAQFEFGVDGLADPEDYCSREELGQLFRRLETKLEDKANDYLLRWGISGLFENFHIEGYDDRRDLVEEDVELEIEGERRLLFVYKCVGGCNQCPPDNSDGRLLRLRAMNPGMRKDTINSWVNDHLTDYVQRLIKNFGSETCAEHASEFSATFTLL